ncbi:MAG: class I SAM-dependent RNA methyltransferase [Vicinamibacteraceae bacterium]
MLKPGDLVELTILKPVVGGRMMARSPDGVVLVAGAIPGERVLARIERATRDVAHAATVKALEPSAARRPLARDPACGGLSYAHIDYPAQVQLKREVIADALARIGRLHLAHAPPVTPSSEQAYRLRARFHVRGGRVGWFREGTHDLCSARGSGQIMDQALDAIDRLVSRLPASVRDAVDTIELAENVPATSRVLHLTPRAGERFGPALPWEDAAAPDVTGISWSRDRGDSIEALCGVPWVADSLEAIIPGATRAATFEVRRHATSFFQANRYLLPALLNAVTRWIGDGLLVDLYAGVGLFAMGACTRGAAEVIAVEGDAVSARDLDQNARPFSPTLRVVRDSVERFLARADPLGPRATLIVDPPRTGISRAAVQGIIAAGAARLVYVSCDVATFARDVRRFLDAGYALVHLEGFDLFPNTGHVEVVAVMDLG